MDAPSILAWWERSRGFFAEHMPSAVAQLNNEAARLTRLLARDEEVVVCALGSASVGKSTLLNAIVAGKNTVLPAGA
jgi:putative ribosome biogenesis GTPase RsgA